MSTNKNLHAAKAAKNNEFYTKYADIESECENYKKYFKGKTILCNCNDRYDSNTSGFFRYFAMNFNLFEIKKLIIISYGDDAYRCDIDSIYDTTGDGVITIDDCENIAKMNCTKLLGDGAYDSDESIAALNEADIVCTNPPFSVFDNYLDFLISHNKEFLIIGPRLACTHKTTFNHFKNNKVWLGFNSPSKFTLSDGNDSQAVNTCWYTNLKNNIRNEKITLVRTMSDGMYDKYDNWDAIRIKHIVDIPKDYNGYMGVSFRFFSHFNPKQFDIIDCVNGGGFLTETVMKNSVWKAKKAHPLNINGKETFASIIIKRKKDTE